MIMPKYKHNLFDMIDAKALTKPKDQIKIMFYTLIAVKYLHDMGILHRDLKSDNIMLTDTMDPIIIDFSLWFRVQGSGFRVQGSGFRVQGSGFRVQQVPTRTHRLFWRRRWWKKEGKKRFF